MATLKCAYRKLITFFDSSRHSIACRVASQRSRSTSLTSARWRHTPAVLPYQKSRVPIFHREASHPQRKYVIPPVTVFRSSAEERSMSSSSSNNEDINSILQYWFGDSILKGIESASDTERFKLWFGASESVDSFIKEKFEGFIVKAGEGKLADWEETPEGTLAIVILLDQFTRNCFRGSGKSFYWDDTALTVAKRAISRGFDKKLPIIMRSFFYLPFEHCERLEEQRAALVHFRELCDDAPPPLKAFAEDMFKFSKRHEVVIERFGRFPHRNALLGRESTFEEVEYLKEGKPF